MGVNLWISDSLKEYGKFYQYVVNKKKNEKDKNEEKNKKKPVRIKQDSDSYTHNKLPVKKRKKD